MFKKAFIASAVLAASTGLAFANGGTFVPPHHVGAFYLGAAVSRDFAHFDTNQTFRSTEKKYGKTFTFTDRVNHDLGDDGWNGEIFGGYGMTFQNHYYLGAEIFGSLSNVDAKYSHLGTFDFQYRCKHKQKTLYRENKNVELDYSYGISVLPGVKLTDHTLLYGRVGWIRGRFELTGNYTDPKAKTYGRDRGVSLPIQTKETENGIQLGGGFETMVWHNISLRGEYDWNYFNDISAGRVKTFTKSRRIKVDGGKKSRSYAYSAKVDNPTINQVKFAAIYHFMA